MSALKCHDLSFWRLNLGVGEMGPSDWVINSPGVTGPLKIVFSFWLGFFKALFKEPSWPCAPFLWALIPPSLQYRVGGRPPDKTVAMTPEFRFPWKLAEGSACREGGCGGGAGGHTRTLGCCRDLVGTEPLENGRGLGLSACAGRGRRNLWGLPIGALRKLEGRAGSHLRGATPPLASTAGSQPWGNRRLTC